ncbi:MAG: condensation domain-containing protein, partial [Pyrinomonadaceae bacterium]
MGGFPRALPGAARDASTLVELLRWKAGQQPAQLAYTFLLDGETQESQITYGDLDERARAIGAALQSLGAEGERALLLFPPGLDYIAAFFGCLYAAAVAVPAYPPRAGGREGRRSRLDAIVNDCRPSVILGTEAIISALKARNGELPALSSARWLAADSLESESGLEWKQPNVSGETLAFLQYTSGSTATPKGVMVTHANLLHNQRLIQSCFRQEERSVIVGWLPLYHDMGLIGNVLHPLYVNARCILMAPTAFLQKPLRWLRAISTYKATTSGGPNFAYDLCARKITDEQCEALDLSSWETAFNGAEPVRHDAMERFAARFSPYGFRREAFSPCYGLAEATLIVTGAASVGPPASLTLQQAPLEQNEVVPARAGAEGARMFVSSGEALSDQEVAIVEPESATLCAAGRVGEIWVSGPSVARGYWGRPSETEQTFGARLAGHEASFLRTGDLGFFHDGQLFVTGRLKDLIVIRGRNLYPQDIELTVEQSHGDLRPGGGAAFSVDAGNEEQLVVVQEVEFRRRPEATAVIDAIRQAVAEEHEVQLHAVVLIKPGTIPQTSSGKIQRSRCRAQFEAGELQVVAEWRAHEVVGETREPQSPASPLPLETRAVESWLAGRLATKLGLSASEMDINQPVTLYGIDSMLAVELAHETEAALGFAPPLASFLRGASIADLAAMTVQRTVADAAAAAAAETLREGDSAAVLSYGQKALWFLHQLTPESAAYNLSSALRIQSALDVAALRRAFQSLVMRHASLRTTFQVGPEGEPVREVQERAEVCFQEEDAVGWSEDELTQRLQMEAHRPFDLARGSLLRISLFRRSPREHVLLLSLHHIVADFWSLAVLAHELGALYREESEGTPSGLAPLRFDYGDYVRAQMELLSGSRGARLLAYWKEQLAGAEFGLNLPTDRPRPPVQTYKGASEPFALDAELSAALKSVCKERETTLYVLLLAAFQTLLHRHTGQKDLVVGSPISGRHSADWAGLVGYFVNPLVLRASFSDDPTFEQLLSQVRRTVLDAFEHQDYPFPLLVERLQPERDASQSPLFQTMFVFQKAQPLGVEGLAAFALGETGACMQLGGLSVESVGLKQRIAQFDLTLTIAEVGEGLAATLEYNTDLFDAATMRRMAGRLQTLLRAIAENPSQTVSALPILTDEERGLLLDDFNAAARRPLPPPTLLHRFFEQQAALTPDATALVYADQRFSYAELDRRATRLAQRLLALGLPTEARVGLLLTRRPHLLVALLAVLKAGAAYVPLDPAYPRERLRF